MKIKGVDGAWFTDEKIVTVNPLRNSQNSRVYSYVRKKSEIPRKRFCTERQHHPGSVIIPAFFQRI